MSTGAELIAAERQRQVSVEGWTASHDEEHNDGALIAAAVCYANYGLLFTQYDVERATLPPGWPWTAEDWKPGTDPVRMLVKAGALLAAEIDRLTRLV